MRILIFMLATTLCSASAFAAQKSHKPASSAKAQKVAKAKPRMTFLRYGELMLLSKPKRIAYLKEITKVLVVLESQQAKFEVADNRVNELREQVALLMRQLQIMPEAIAAEDDFVDVNTIVPVWDQKLNDDNGGFKCVPDRIAVFHERTGTCLLRDFVSKDSTSKGSIQFSSGSAKKDCPPFSQMVEFGSVLRTRHCIPMASWKLLNKPSQDRISSGRMLKPGVLSGVHGQQTYADITLAPASSILPSDTSSGVDPKSANAALAERRKSDVDPKSLNAELADQRKNDVDPKSSNAELADRRKNDVDPKSLNAMSAAEKKKAAEALALEAKQKPSTPGDGPGRVTLDKGCEPPEPLQCQELTEDQLAEINTRFASSSANNECIRGGFFGKYPGRYTKGGCKVEKTPLTSAIPCPTGTELCNPAVFCYGFEHPDTKEFVTRAACAKVTQTFTKSCEKFENDRINGKTVQPKDSNGKPGVRTDGSPLEVVYRRCDPATEVKLSQGNFQDEYTKLIESTKASYERLCVKTIEFQAKFCAECNTIRNMIARANCAAGAKTDSKSSEPEGTIKEDGDKPLADPSTIREEPSHQ